MGVLYVLSSVQAWYCANMFTGIEESLIVIFSISSLLSGRWSPWKEWLRCCTDAGWGEPSLLTVASLELCSLVFWEMLNRRSKNQVPEVTCLGIAELSRDYFMVRLLRIFNKTRCIVISERWCFPNLSDHRPFEEISINTPLKTFWEVMVERHVFSFFQTHVFQSWVFWNEFWLPSQWLKCLMSSLSLWS